MPKAAKLAGVRNHSTHSCEDFHISSINRLYYYTVTNAHSISIINISAANGQRRFFYQIGPPNSSILYISIYSLWSISTIFRIQYFISFEPTFQCEGFLSIPALMVGGLGPERSVRRFWARWLPAAPSWLPARLSYQAYQLAAHSLV